MSLVSVDSSGDLSLAVKVNGISAQPPFLAHSCSGVLCTVSGTFWPDLDAAETANPGMFINVPLNIDLDVIDTVPGTTGTASVTATMVKK